MQKSLPYEQIDARLAALDCELKRHDLEPHERALLVTIHRIGVRDGANTYLERPFSVLARALGCSERWARDARDRLVASGFLLSISQGVGKPVLLVVDWQAIFSSSHSSETTIDRFRRLRSEHLSTSELSP